MLDKIGNIEAGRQLPVPERIYSGSEARYFLGITEPTFRKYLNEGRIKARKIGKQWNISGFELLKFLGVE